MENVRKDTKPSGGSGNLPPQQWKPNQPKKKPQRQVKPEPVKSVVVPPPKERWAKFDVPLFVITLTLVVFGAGMLLSASFAFGMREFDNYYHFFTNQSRFILIGLGIMIFLSFVNYRILMNKKLVIIATVGTVVLMLGVMLMGVAQGGATRWINIGFVFQPSEILKFVLIVVLAYITHHHPETLQRFRKGFVPFALIIMIACGLVFAQRHLSGTIIMFGIGLTMMVVSPIRLPYIVVAITALAVMVAIGVLVMKASGYTYFQDRIDSWRAPESDVQGATFQTYQSLVTIGSGGWFGLGLGNSHQKFSFLPAMHNDFIFSVIVEELGFVGGVFVMILFVVFILRGFYIAVNARDRFGMMLAVGITAQIGIQAFLNIAVATNSVPNTGISLPFFSYGGTSIVMLLAQIGILLNISRKAKIG